MVELRISPEYRPGGLGDTRHRLQPAGRAGIASVFRGQHAGWRPSGIRHFPAGRAIRPAADNAHCTERFRKRPCPRHRPARRSRPAAHHRTCPRHRRTRAHAECAASGRIRGAIAGRVDDPAGVPRQHAAGNARPTCAGLRRICFHGAAHRCAHAVKSPRTQCAPARAHRRHHRQPGAGTVQFRCKFASAIRHRCRNGRA